MIYQGVFLPSNGLSPTSPLPLPVVAILWAPGYNSSGGVVLNQLPRTNSPRLPFTSEN